MNLPLKNVKVLDLSSVLAGPYCSLHLGDYGATVTKIESPQGDLLRKLGGRSKSGMLSPQFMNINRNKKSLCIDLKNPQSDKIIKKLISTHDVLLTNMRDNALKKLHLDYNSVEKIRKDIIYCHIVGFGSKGKYSSLPAYDNIIQGASGFSDLFKRRDNSPGFVPLGITDRISGLTAFNSILLSIIQRNISNEGQYIEVPMYEIASTFILTEHIGDMFFKNSSGKTGDLRVLNPSTKPIPTKNGYICVSANTDKQAFAFFDAIDRPKLKNNKKFDSVTARYENLEDFTKIRTTSLTSKTTEEWMAIFLDKDIPAMPVNSFEDLIYDEQLNSSDIFEEMDHPIEGKINTIKQPVSFSKTKLSYKSLAPSLGEDYMSILQEIGLKKSEIHKLIKSKCIHPPKK